jgi:hypothetical protein
LIQQPEVPVEEAEHEVEEKPVEVPEVRTK